MRYDANGNILPYLRHGHAAGTNNFPGMNRLKYVRDGVATATTYTNDLENQPSNNYAYDQVGNIIGDVSEGLAYAWTNDQKLRQVDKGATTAHLTFGYDAMRNRVLKTQKVNATRSTKTYYIRDAQGNVLATYTGFVKNTGAYDSLRLSEHHVYGSSRLGLVEYVWKKLYPVPTAPTSVRGYTGRKRYELTNHLGNVLAVITDRKRGQGTLWNAPTHYLADVIESRNYYPFGMVMPGRKSPSGNSKYRFGFNGKENDDEVKGDDLHIDYGMRVSDPRTGRFFSVDPIAAKFPMSSGYAYAMNRVIDGIDLDGYEYIDADKSFLDMKFGIVWIDLKKANELHPDVFIHPRQPIAGGDPSGNSFVGYSVPIGQFKPDIHVAERKETVSVSDNVGWENTSGSANFDGTWNDPPSINPFGDANEEFTKRRKDGGLDKRSATWNNKMMNPPPPNGIPGTSRVLLIYNAYSLYKDALYAYKVGKAVDARNSELGLLKKSAYDVSQALHAGDVPDQFKDAGSLSTIVNILFKGEANGASQPLIDVAMSIAEKYSGTVEKAYVKEFPGTNMPPIIGGAQSSPQLFEQLKQESEQNAPRENNIKLKKVWKSKN